MIICALLILICDTSFAMPGKFGAAIHSARNAVEKPRELLAYNLAKFVYKHGSAPIFQDVSITDVENSLKDLCAGESTVLKSMDGLTHMLRNTAKDRCVIPKIHIPSTFLITGIYKMFRFE